MSNSDEQLDQFEQRAHQLFDESVTSLDANTLSRLNQARHAAMDVARKERVLRPRWLMPAGSMAALALVAVVAFQYLNVYPHGDSHHVDTGTQTVSAMEDMEIIASSDELDLLQDVDFYDWLDSADAADSVAG